MLIFNCACVRGTDLYLAVSVNFHLKTHKLNYQLVVLEPANDSCVPNMSYRDCQYTK